MKSARVILLTAVVLLAGCAPPGTTPPAAQAPQRPWNPNPAPSAAPSVVATCSSAGVKLATGDVDAAMGLRVMSIDLTNCSHQPYRVQGYPVMRVLDEDRHVAGVRTLRGITDITGSTSGWDGEPPPVTLRPGEQATALVAWRNTYDDIRDPRSPSRFSRWRAPPASRRSS